MEYRNLGRTGVRVSKICLGCMNFGGKTSPAESESIIDRAIAEGINFLDTANIYNQGRSEEVVGAALKRNGKRSSIVLATKVNMAVGDDPNARGNSRRHILEQCDASLKRLQTDHIDLYQIHRPQSDIPIDETLQALDDLVRSGKVRYIGTSTFAAWQLMEALAVSRELRLNRFISEQPPYNLLDRRIERELVPMAQTYGIAILPWSPIAGGLLTGKYRREEPLPEGSRYAASAHLPWARRRINDFSFFPRLEALQALAADAKTTVPRLALSWCMAQPGITSPIVGPRTMEHFHDYLEAASFEVTPELQRKIDDIAPPGSSVSAFYEADFGPHTFR